MTTLSLKQIINQRLIAVLFIGFSSGLPFALTNSTLQAWFTEANINLSMIGALSLLGVPYTLKFLWAPLMDYVSLPYFGKRRGFILLTQLLLVVMLFILANMNPVSETMKMGVIALWIAFLSASQDIAIDAYRTDVLLNEERGLGAAYFVFSYRIAALISGGLALICADYFGFKITYELMALLLLISMIPAIRAPRIIEPPTIQKNLFQLTIASMHDLLQREKAILLLLFIIFYKFGDALALSLMTNFLLQGLGFSLTDVGLVYKTVSFVGIILGAFVAGILLIRWNIYRALLLFGLAQAFSNLTFAVLALVGKQMTLMAVSLFIESFCSGLSTAAFFAFLMSLCNHRFTATQFALFTAIASIGRTFLGPFAAFLVQHFGWVQYFLWSFVLCFPGIIILILLKERVLSYAEVPAE